MNNNSKWIIGLGLLVILSLLLLLWKFAPAIQQWLADTLLEIIILLATFATGWLLGRFGGCRRRSREEQNARNITKAQK